MAGQVLDPEGDSGQVVTPREREYLASLMRQSGYDTLLCTIVELFDPGNREVYENLVKRLERNRSLRVNPDL